MQFGQRSLKQYMAVVDDADLLDHLLHLAQKMARDQHRRARGGGHVPDERAHLLNARGVQTVRRLIQNQQLRAAQQRHGNAEPLLHAERILPDPAVAVLRQMHNVQRHSRGNVTLRLLDPAKAAPILRANGLTAHSDSCVVTLPPLQDALLADLVQKLAACGAGVVELTPHTKTLEEIFLSLTSEEAD